MPPTKSALSYEEFLARLNGLVEKFRHNLRGYSEPDYLEERLKGDFLSELWSALGWDLGNDLGLIGPHREVELESPAMVGNRRKKADYLFRADKVPRFICEAKKPAFEFTKRDVFQAKRYAWAKDLPLAILTRFTETRIYLVGAEPDLEQPDIGLCQTIRHDQLVANARFLWDSFSRPAVGAGSIDAYLEAHSRGIIAKGPRQAWLFRPDRTQALDGSFLAFLDDARRRLAESLLAENPKAGLKEETRLNEAVQRILDRLVFLRICEDRDIDIGTVLGTLLQTWENLARRQRHPPEPLYAILVRHFRYLDRRPPGTTPFFNGQLFKPHFSEELTVGDDFLRWFLDKLTSDDSPYLFSAIPVEVLGSIYERFLGKTIQFAGRKATLVDSPAVRKAEGAFYTPLYVVGHIVERTVGAALADKTPADVRKLRFLDPACGSGSFLIRVYERIIEHYLDYLLKHPKYSGRREMGYVDAQGNFQLNTATKRQILVDNIYGVDLDQQAVEVTHLSLYLKLLEGETRHSLNQQKDWQSAGLGDEPPALLPPLDQNIKHGNSIMEVDASLRAEAYPIYHPSDFAVLFPSAMAAGGFDAIIGNPPYIPIETMDEEERAYYPRRYPSLSRKYDTSVIFTLRGMGLLKPEGLLGYISSVTWQTGENFAAMRRQVLGAGGLVEVVNLPFDTFPDAYVDAGIFVISKKARSHYGIFRFPKKTRIYALGEVALIKVPTSLIAAPDFRIVLDPVAYGILARARSADFAALGDLTDSTQGLAAGRFRTAPTKKGSGWVRFDPKAEVYRYVFHPSASAVYADMNEHVSLQHFYGAAPKLLIRRLINRQDRLDIAFTDAASVFKKDINPFVVTTTRVQPYYLLGVLNSKLLSYLYVNTSTIATKDDFRQTTLAELRRLPIPIPDLQTSEGRTLHDTIEANALKLEELTSKLDRYRADSPTAATLRAAIVSLEGQIDQLVCSAYSLTANERQALAKAYTAA